MAFRGLVYGRLRLARTATVALIAGTTAPFSCMKSPRLAMPAADVRLSLGQQGALSQVITATAIFAVASSS